jgi:hypothetical protein
MRRYFESLRPADVSAIHSVPGGIFLVRVDRAQYRWHKQKPHDRAPLLHVLGDVEAELVLA